jgi:hypothetical protein
MKPTIELHEYICISDSQLVTTCDTYVFKVTRQGEAINPSQPPRRVQGEARRCLISEK